MQMADRFRELGDPAMAGLADVVVARLSKLAYDANIETQPIEVKREEDDDG